MTGGAVEQVLRLTVATLGVAAAGCNPYLNRSGEFSAGPADPLSYPPAFVGAGGDHTKAGKGSFTEVAAYVGGRRVGYYSFPLSPTALGKMSDPLKLSDANGANPMFPAPKAYVFDPTAQSPYPASPACAVPADYVYDARRDEVRLDEQGPIFTALPTATYTPGVLPTWSYEPVVQETPVTSASNPCQGLTTESGTLKSSSVSVADPDGKYLAWAIIDTGAAVYRLGQTSSNSNGVSAQRYGWYEHFLVAYLDGGYLPTTTDMVMGAPVLHMVTQTLYVPRSPVTTGSGAMMTTGPGAPGQGYDVLDAARGDAGFSPVCAVMTYDAGATPLTPDALPKDAATVKQLYGTTLKPPTTNPYLFCLQVP
jgi:hypothetical protein